MQLWKESLKKNQTCMGFEPYDLCDTGAGLYFYLFTFRGFI